MKPDTNGLIADWRRDLKQTAKNPNRVYDYITQHIYTGPVIYLPATTDQLTKDNTTMNTPMFDQPENEVVAVFNEYGSLIVKFNHCLSADEFKQYNYGVAAAVRGIARAENYCAAGDTAQLVIVIKSNQAKRAFDIRHDVQAYTERFLAKLEPAQKQVSLF